MEEEGHRVAAWGRAVIDTRAPFKSVKEAVALFGERVLAGELHAKHLQEMQCESINGPSNYTTLAAELEETKQSLEQALEQNDAMTNTLESLKLELQRTKAHLTKFQAQEEKMKEVKFVENAKELRIVEAEGETERMKCVKFGSSPHSLARAMASCDHEKVQKKKQKKMAHPLVGWLTGKKSSTQTCRSSKEEVILSAYM